MPKSKKATKKSKPAAKKPAKVVDKRRQESATDKPAKNTKQGATLMIDVYRQTERGGKLIGTFSPNCDVVKTCLANGYCKKGDVIFTAPPHDSEIIKFHIVR